jgi:hypothetical protein
MVPALWGIANLDGDAPHSFQVVRRGSRKTSFDYVHTQARQ